MKLKKQVTLSSQSQKLVTLWKQETEKTTKPQLHQRLESFKRQSFVLIPPIISELKLYSFIAQQKGVYSAFIRLNFTTNEINQVYNQVLNQV